MYGEFSADTDPPEYATGPLNVAGGGKPLRSVIDVLDDNILGAVELVGVPSALLLLGVGCCEDQDDAEFCACAVAVAKDVPVHKRSTLSISRC